MPRTTLLNTTRMAWGTCYWCSGAGHLYGVPCIYCKGTGR